MTVTTNKDHSMNILQECRIPVCNIVLQVSGIRQLAFLEVPIGQGRVIDTQLGTKGV